MGWLVVVGRSVGPSEVGGLGLNEGAPELMGDLDVVGCNEGPDVEVGMEVGRTVGVPEKGRRVGLAEGETVVGFSDGTLVVVGRSVGSVVGRTVEGEAEDGCVVGELETGELLKGAIVGKLGEAVGEIGAAEGRADSVGCLEG